MNPQCKARSKRTGNQCQRPAMNGAVVCRHHGGAAPQVKAKAQQRLDLAADRMTRELLGIATNEDVSPETRLKAIVNALDRAMGKAPMHVDVGLAEPKPYERLLAGMETGTTRAESRARRGFVQPTPPVSLPSAYSGREVLDVVAEPMPDGPGDRPGWSVGDAAASPHATGPEFGRQAGSGPAGRPPGKELMTTEEANEVLLQQAREANMRNERH